MPPMKIIKPLALSAALMIALPSLGAQSETMGRAVDDSAITAKVQAELKHDFQLKSFDIHVDTDKGVVHLGGVVDDRVEKEEATRVAKRVDDVKDVVNDLATRK